MSTHPRPRQDPVVAVPAEGIPKKGAEGGIARRRDELGVERVGGYSIRRAG